jgi:hypothetical protein
MKLDGEWFTDLWRSRGWDDTEEGSVWRVEFKFKREVLHELEQEGVFHGIEDVYELPGRLPLLWAYAAGHVGGDEQGIPDGWLRCVVPSEERDRTGRAGRHIQPGKLCKGRSQSPQSNQNILARWCASGGERVVLREFCQRMYLCHPSSETCC